MGKNFENFVRTHNGHQYGSGQCVAGMQEYIRWGTGVMPSTPGPTAEYIGRHWQSNDLAKYCKDVTSQVRKNGDIIFMTSAQAGGNGAGHVAMYYNGRLFGQNQNTDGSGGPFNLGVPYTGCFLALRPKFLGLEIYITCVGGIITGIRTT